MTAKVFTIAAGQGFAETLARGILAREGGGDPLALSRIAIFLPTRRAVRTMGEVFARVAGGAALLPEMKPLGGVDEDELPFDAQGDIDLPPAISRTRRRLLLAAMIARWGHARKTGLGFAQSAALARGLAAFLDEVQTQGADLSKLDALAPAALAEHWAEVKAFLSLLREQWPALLAAEGAIDPADHRNRSLRALARRLDANPPDAPVIAAGSTGSIPATAELLGTIARLPKGAVILPGLDHELDEESWANLDPGHPQFGMKQLLARIGVARADVKDWSDAPPRARETVLRETLRPAPTTDAWRALAESGSPDIAAGLEGLSLIEAATPQAEAGAIALVLREMLETPGKTAALVTPDRNLARRVAAEMARWGVAIDDSAGRPLANTTPGTFLCLLAEAAEAEFAPVALLALLKHPLAAGGEAVEAFRAKVRELDRWALRGPRPNPGLNGIAIRDAELKAWFARVSKILRPMEKAFAKREHDLAGLVKIHAGVAQALAASHDESGAARLWRGDAGEAASNLVEALFDAAGGLPKIETRAYPSLFRGFAEEIPVRARYGQHPRLSILGPLEARLQSFDLVVLGGLNEGRWPEAAATDPWLSRPMRQTLGLEPPERAIGLAAHDFAALAAGGRVVLTRSLKEQGSPTVASRWVQRLTQLAKGLGLAHKLTTTNYTALAARIDEPAKPSREPKPAPRPPVAARPRNLSVTEIEKWLRDPYWIYAKHVLRLKPLDPLEAEIGPLERGTAVHAALERFLRDHPDALPPDADARLIAIAQDVFREAGVPKAVEALWGPRFLKAARWFVGLERERRAGILRSFIEIKGERKFASPGGEFTLRCKADRIDVLAAGGAAVVDYKTGAPPTKKQVKELLAPQLPLEGAILAGGGFEAAGKLAAAALLYIQFSGGREPGALIDVSGDDAAALAAEAEAKLIQRIADFDDEATAYLPRVMPYRADVTGDYDHLARVREWSLSGWEDDQ